MSVTDTCVRCGRTGHNSSGCKNWPVQIIVPWPSSRLSPNARGHWATLARAKKAYRTQCAWEAKSEGAHHVAADRLSVGLVFHPPDRRRRDLDNCIASVKSGLDGIADTVGIDDSRWHLFAAMGMPVKGGCVVVTLEPAA